MDLSLRYSHWLERLSRAREQCDTAVREEAPLQFPRPIADEEIQARWFAGELGRRFTTTAGAEVEVLHFGAWNAEPGPTFAGARFSFNGGAPVEGGLEVRVDARAWGETAEPEYDTTRLHCFAGGGAGGGGSGFGTFGWRPSLTHAGREVPQVALDISAIEFDTPALPPCGGQPPFAAYTGEKIAQILEAAAQFRLARKAARIQRLARQTNPSEALYQALAETLGYRHNKLPFTLLAQRFPLSLLRRQPDHIEPLLFAGSGFLSAMEFSGMPDDTRGYLREVWKRWWPRRSEFDRLSVPPSLWSLQAVRPVNHPQRRVAALAELVRQWPVIESLAKSCHPGTIAAFFKDLRHTYWDHHYTLTSRRAPRRMALIGATRVHEMLANVFYPLAVVEQPALWRAYYKLPARAGNERLAHAVNTLFTPAQRPLLERLLRRVVNQQGLLQLLENIAPTCGNPDCPRCQPSERLRLWGGTL